jgi:Transglycosylase SLT domain
VVDSQLTDSSGAPALGLVWELAKRHLHPPLERFAYDLNAPRVALARVVRGAAPAERSAELEAIVNGLQVLGPRVEGAAVVVPIAMELPDAWLAAPPAAAPAAAPLTETELEALERSLQPWDAFLASIVKQVALEGENSALRRRLFGLLIESRYRLVGILTGDEPAAGDPLRALFMDAWDELRAILTDSSLARYALFVDAGDALAALDRAAPGLGMTLSAEGLRQWARSALPATGRDPLAYDLAVDREMRTLFELEELPEPTPPPGRSLLDFLIRPAYASSTPALDRWVPRRDEYDLYSGRIASLLQEVSREALQKAQLPAPHDKTYRDMVPTTALIESCWRQYVSRGGKVTYLRSGAGSVGIMQINQVVWRGFYEIERLRWDTAYNARAGAQILMRYLKDYAIPYAEQTGDPDHVARAAYAVYNAGPRAVGRFNKPERHPREERVDEHLWTLYQGIASGGQADLRSCGVTAAAAAR